MTDLTEQWKKGELPEGWYYVKGSRVEGIYAFTAEYLNNMYRPQNSDRIIEQVPSYDEWLEKTKSLKVLAEAYCKEKQQNDKLKELLKECKGIFDECFSPSAKHGELYKKINEALR